MKNRKEQYTNAPHQNNEGYCGGGKRKRTKHTRMTIAIVAIGLALLILICIFVFRGCNAKNTELVGTWRYDEYTEYVFTDSSKGYMRLEGNVAYEFNYSIRENVLYLDFMLDYVTDCQYAYSLDGHKLTFVGGTGTAEIGKVYELTKTG